MATLTPAQIYALAKGAGLATTPAAVATAIALAESGGRTDAIGDVALENGTWGPSVGLWQIRSLKAESGKGTPRDATRLTDPKFNAAAMASISGAGKSFNAWSTYKSGAYKAQLSKLSATDIAGGTLASLLPGSLGEAVSAPIGDAVAAAGDAVSGWSGQAMKLALYVVGAAATAGLVIVGAVHTVSN